MVENEQMMNLIISSPTKNILSSIFYEKTRLRPDMVEERAILGKDRCLFTRDRMVTQLLDSEFYLFGERKLGTMLMGIPFLVGAMPKKLWLNERDIYEYNLVIYYNREKPRIGKE